MRRVLMTGSKKGLILTVSVLLIITTGAGIATAAVSASFSTSYDGWNDQSSTDYPGHEIQVSGELTISGDNAVDPRIVIKSSQHSVLDTTSVNLLQEDTAINFNKRFDSGRVIYTTKEIPSDTKLQIEFVLYYIGGAEQTNIKVADVNVFWETPEGESEQETFDISAELQKRPEDEISRLEGEVGNLQDKIDNLETRVSRLNSHHPLPVLPYQQFLAYLASLMVVLLLIYIWRGSREPPGPPKP